MKTFLDSETCGLYGMPVLLQYAFDDGRTNLRSIWKEPIGETLEIIEQICQTDVIAFNIAFDWFQLCKLYTTFALAPSYDWIPEDHIDELAILEEKARHSGDCIKPLRACDLMLHARKGPFQSLMAREDIRLRLIPNIIAEHVRNHLEKTIEIEGIYFARRKDKYAPKWKIFDSKDNRTGKIIPGFKDIILKWAPSGSLKTLAEHLGIQTPDKIVKFTDIEVHRDFWPEEFGWAPFALAVGRPGRWNKAWPEVIKKHIDHWHFHRIARQYAEDDITYTRGLYYHKVFGEPEPGDDDSTLACMVAACRWKGFKIKAHHMKAMQKSAQKKYAGVPMAPGPSKYFIQELMSESERVAMKGSTKKTVLEETARMECDCKITGESPDKCELCGGSGLHPAAQRAKIILDARRAKKEEEIYEKLLLAGRFHASFIVIGTLSSRMAGGDGLNPQGIKHTDEVRDCFPLCDDGFILCGGDFDAFEVVLADAEYNDPALRADLMADKKIHAIFGEQLFGVSYEEVMRSKGTEDDKYTAGKQGVFAMIYGGDWQTLVNKQGIDEEVAKKAYEGFVAKYPKIKESRDKIFNSFCSMRQDARGRVTWAEPADYVESLMGFRRYFTLENKICKSLFQLAENPPEAWKDFKIKVVRRQEKGPQAAHAAVRSALYGAAFAIQAAAMRAAANHRIQSTGATITKRVQRRIWDIQPHGVNSWRVVPMNVHDELMVPTRPAYVKEVEKAVHETVESFRAKVPLIKIEWDDGLESWSKGITEGKVKTMRKMHAEGRSPEEIASAFKLKGKEGIAKVMEILERRSWDWI